MFKKKIVSIKEKQHVFHSYIYKFKKERTINNNYVFLPINLDQLNFINQVIEI